MEATAEHFPPIFEFNTHGVAKTVEQGSPNDILACTYRLCLCEEGTREELPEFGIPQTIFQTVPIDLKEVEEAISFWEPRAEPELTELALEAANQGARTINVEVG
jgi:hypothetical protein